MPQIPALHRAAAAARHARRPALVGTALAVLATIVLIAPSQGDPPPVIGGPPPDGAPTVKLVNGFDTHEVCLSPAGGSTALNDSVVGYYCVVDPARHWTLTRRNGAYLIRNVHSGMCLSPAGGSPERNTVIVQYFCDGDPSRLCLLQGGPNKV